MNRKLIQGALLLIGLAAIISSCAFSSIEKGTFKAKSYRLFWTTEDFSASYDPTNGTYQVNLGSSGQDIDSAIQLLESASALAK